MKITVPTTLKKALANQWPWALLIVIGGVAAGIWAGFNLPQANSYLASSSVRVAKTSVTGVDMPCTPAALPSLVKSTDVFGKVPGVTPSSIKPELSGADVMQIGYVAPTGTSAIAQSQALAAQLSAVCKEQTRKSYESYNWFLAKQKAQRQKQIAALDARLIPASDKTATRDQLLKQQSDLKVKIAALQSQVTVQTADVKAKRDQQAGLLPSAQQAIAESDPLYKGTEMQLKEARTTLTTMQAHFKPSYPPIATLNEKIASLQTQLTDYKKELDSTKPPELDPDYRAARAIADQAQAALEATQSELTGAKSALEDVGARLTTPTTRVAIAALERQKAELVKAYQTLATQFNTALTEESAIPAGGPVAVVPQPAFAVRVGLVFAVLLGLLTLLIFVVLAIVVALLLDALDRRLLTVQSITKLYGKPVIATVRPKRSA